MRRSFKVLTCLLTFGLMPLWACSDGSDGSPDVGVDQATSKPYGMPCGQDSECESTRCIDGHCSKLCSAFADCPPAAGKYFFCGKAKDDLVACYPKAYDNRDYATGYNCSSDGKCGIGWRCMGVPGEPDRYCSPECKGDKECPPTMRCAEIQDGDKTEKRCMKRAWGHPCDIDDQCGGPSDLCITDNKGNKYCSKACDKTKPATCPGFATCEDAGNGKLQCRHKAGVAYKDKGDLCSPCVFHYEYQSGQNLVGVYDTNTCAEGGRCLRLSPYTNEAACAAPCAKDADDPNKTCTKDDDCDSKRCVTTQSGTKRCAWCPENFGCTNSTKLCVPIMQNPQPPPDIILGTCFP